MENFMTLKYFLDAYLTEAEGDLGATLREFAKAEGLHKVDSLRGDLDLLVASHAPSEAISLGLSMVQHHSKVLGLNPFRLIVQLHEQVQLVGSPTPYKKTFDVFISHSHKDSSTANRIALELKAAGFRVWLDQWEVLGGHNIVDEVFRGIRSSEFLMVLLSTASVSSPWVTQEVTTALLDEIEKQKVTVLPVKLDDTEIPAPLRSKAYADLSRNWETGIRYLLASLEAHRSRRQLVREIQEDSGTILAFERLHSFYQQVQSEMVTIGWSQDEAFKDVIIGPPDTSLVNIPKQEILKKIEDCRVKLRGWGGAPFPYDEYPGTRVDRLADGVRVYDSTPWPFADWSFSYWRMSESGLFVHRSDVYEDHEPALKGRRILAVEWVLKDICSPLLFAHRLCISLERPTPLVVKYRWRGLRGRKLVLLDRSRVPLRRSYQSSEDEFVKEVLVNRETDLLPVAESVVKDVLWIFQWESFPRDLISSQVSELLSGTFPR